MGTKAEEEAHRKIEEAAAMLDRSQERLGKLREKLAKGSVKVMSADRMVTIELDATGELSAVRFNTQKYRRMAPAELSTVLLETITKAREQSRERIVGAFRSVMPTGVGLGLDDLLGGQRDLEAMFDSARRQAREMVASLGADPAVLRRRNGSAR
jgi:DNA-binding protein YbaB